ncbi:MAG TPA: hypothetical protein VFQ61_32505 [Polyangiaceae bacterium]|nr:hypothetical protein [Polyangiaceae bacterium]
MFLFGRRGGARLSFLTGLSCVATVVFVLCVLAERPAHAYPWMIRHSYTTCNTCHADPSGGELLTLYGHAISYEVLSTKWGGRSEASASRRLREEREVAAAISRAAHQKNAPKKKVAAEDVDLEGEGKSKTKAAAADANTAEANTAEGEAAAGDTEESAVEEGSAEEGAAEGGKAEAGKEEAAEASTASDASGSEAASSEPSPFAGMGIAGPLFGLFPAKDQLLVGGSIRLASIYRLQGDDRNRFFPMQADLYGQVRLGSHFRVGASLGVAKVPVGSPHARAAQITGNQGDGYNAISRTHWIGYDFGEEGQHTIRAGRLNLPFGIRMSEHTMWVRERTQTDRESDQQHGVSLAMGFEKARFELMGILGNYQIHPDKFRQRGYAGFFEYFVAERLTMGVSSLYTTASADALYLEDQKTARQAHGLFVRSAPSEAVAIMAEFDMLSRSRRELGYAGLLQVDTELVSGLHFILSGELADSGYPKNGGPAALPRTAGAGKPALGGWIGAQWFFLPHFDFRVDAIIREQKQILGQFHVYL